MPEQSNLPEGVKVFFVGVCPVCDEEVDQPGQGHHHEVPPASSRLPDGKRPKVLVPAANAEMIRRSDLPAIIEQARQEERQRLEDPEFWARVKESLPPAVRPSTIDCIMAAHAALYETTEQEEDGDA